MNIYVLDTHTLVWHLEGDPRLSTTAKAALEEVDRGEAQAVVSAVSLIECVYLAEKRKISVDAPARLFQALGAQGWANWRVEPVDLGIAQEIQAIPRSQVPDMPDRVIFATALRLGAPLISKDHRARHVSGLALLW